MFCFVFCEEKSIILGFIWSWGGGGVLCVGVGGVLQHMHVEVCSGCVAHAFHQPARRVSGKHVPVTSLPVPLPEQACFSKGVRLTKFCSRNVLRYSRRSTSPQPIPFTRQATHSHPPIHCRPPLPPSQPSSFLRSRLLYPSPQSCTDMNLKKSNLYDLQG